MGVSQTTCLERVDAYPLVELPAEARDAWIRIRGEQPRYASPYFHPTFADAVDETGHRVIVVVGKDANGEVRAVWPLHRIRRRLRPLGWPAADFQGPVAEADLSPLDVLRATSAYVLEVDHLLRGASASVEEHVTAWRPSPWVDLTGGLEAYLERASRSGRANMAQARRRTRQATDRFGTFRVELDSADHTLLDRVIHLKRAQYAATGASDYFSSPSHVQLVHRLLDERGPGLGGSLSVVYAGDLLVAAHFGIRSGPVLHWWFPVYEPIVSKLAPGWILMRELALGAPELGVTRLDLGRGNDEYKRRVMTAVEEVGTAFVARDALTWSTMRLLHSTTASIKTSRIAPPLRSALHKARTATRRQALSNREGTWP